MIVLLLSICTTGYLQAQEPAAPAATPAKIKKDEHIVIHKKGTTTEKLTIVVDGDNITVNGKPLAEFKDDSVEVKSLKISTFRGMPRPPRAPGEPREMAIDMPMALSFDGGPGGAKTMRRNITAHLRGINNAAFLGIATEKSDKGAIVKEVTKESAAEKAGLQKDDIITKIGDSTIESSDRLYTVVGRYKPEDKVTITYLRDGKEKTTTATLGKNKGLYAFNFDKSFDFKTPPEISEFRFSPDDFRNGGGWTQQPRLGLQLKDIEDGKGAQVLEAREEAPATKAGIQKDDIITGMNGVDVHSVDEIRDQMKFLKEGDTVKIEFKRNNKRQSAEVKFPKKLKTSNL
jgi:serine protease Do